MKERMLIVARRGRTRAVARFVTVTTPHFAKMMGSRITVQQGAHTFCLEAGVMAGLKLKENKKSELVGDIDELLLRLQSLQDRGSFYLLVL